MSEERPIAKDVVKKKSKKGKKPKKTFNWKEMAPTDTAAPQKPAAEAVEAKPAENAAAVPKEQVSISDESVVRAYTQAAKPSTDAQAENYDIELKRKKKRKKTLGLITQELKVLMFGADALIAANEQRSNAPDSNRQFTYEEMLSRIFGILREQHSDLVGGSKRIVLKPPHVQREGSKKTAFTNFLDICRDLRRPHEHVLSFLLTEMGTVGSLGGANEALTIKGRFQSKQIESILKRYIIEFVLCQGCKSSDTLLLRENKLFFVQCERCGAHRSVTGIKQQGFQAHVKRRPRG